MEDLINEPVSKAQATKIRNEQLKELPKSGEAYIRVKDGKKTRGIVIRSYGDRPFLLPNGQQRRYVLDKSIKLDLSNDENRLLYGQLMNHPIHVKNGIYAVENNEVDAESKLKHKELEREATGIIFDMKDADVRDFARILLIKGVDKSSIQVLKKEMLDMAEEDPASFTDEWNHSDKPYKILLRRCMDAGLCIERNGRLELNGTGIGNTFEQGIEFLKANKPMLVDLRKQLEKK